jgi:DNA-binding PadR family transcriptional regulator
VLILISVAHGPKYVYALIHAIKELADVEFGPGTLYGALDRLERRLHVIPRAGSGTDNSYLV